MINFFDTILIFTNFLIFIIIQTVFLIIVSEVRILKEVDYLIYFYKPWITEIRNFDKNIIKKNTLPEEKPHNKKLLLKTIGIPSCVIILIIILLIGLGIKYNNKWQMRHTIGLILIGCAYLTELMVYYLIANEYRFINSSSILSNFIKKLKDRIREFPIDEKEQMLVNNLIQNIVININSNIDVLSKQKKRYKLRDKLKEPIPL